MKFLKSLNLGLAFIIEVLLVIALVAWGFSLHVPMWLKVLAGVGVPLVIMAFWAAFLAPLAKNRLKMPWLLIAKVAVFALGTLALAQKGAHSDAVMFGVLAAANIVLALIWKQL